MRRARAPRNPPRHPADALTSPVLTQRQRVNEPRMSQRSRSALVARRTFAWTIGWVFAAALYLLLIDITDLPELIVGAGAAVIAATGLELAREQGIVGESARAHWLLRAHRPLLRLPSDIAIVSLAAVRALVRSEAHVGTFRTISFAGDDDEAYGSGRRALAEAFGSFAPNTFIVGIDEEREVLIAHQLKRSGGREAIDLLELG